MPRKYELPEFLWGQTTQKLYSEWLARKADHIRRDRKRGNTICTWSQYKEEIHRAVIPSNGRDAYTGELLKWQLIGSYNNKEAKAGGREYKAKFALMPTVDHVGDGRGAADFRIRAWRTNDAKSDLSLSDLIQLCHRVLEHVSTSGGLLAEPATVAL